MSKLTCTKKKFSSKLDARMFHQLRFNKPYYVYECPHCSSIHISTEGISDATLQQMIDMIQNSNSIIVKRGKRTVHLVEHRIGTFLVEYYKGKQELKILDELFIGETNE